MYTETSSPRRWGDNARLISPKLLCRGNMCLQFYYHMYGASMGKLNVAVNGRAVFSASGDKGNLWRKASVDLNFLGVCSVRSNFMAKTNDFVPYV